MEMNKSLIYFIEQGLVDFTFCFQVLFEQLITAQPTKCYLHSLAGEKPSIKTLYIFWQKWLKSSILYIIYSVAPVWIYKWDATAVMAACSLPPSTRICL